MAAAAAAGAHRAITADDHAAYIVIAAVLGVCWTLLVLAIRLYIRLRLNGPFGADDAAASFGTFVAICQSALTLVAVHFGMGKRKAQLTRSDLDTMMKLVHAANLLYIVAICCSKCSMALLMARLTRYTRHRVAGHALGAFTVAWAVAALFVIGLQCRLPASWKIDEVGRCPHILTRWIAVEAVSMLIEALISALAVILVWDLSMPRRTKVMVVSAFSVQLLVLIPVAFRLDFFRHPATALRDLSFGLTPAAVTTQAVIHLSVMAATFPCFRQFLQAFDSGLGATTKLSTDVGASGSGSGLGSASASRSAAAAAAASSGLALQSLRAAGTAATTTPTAAGKAPARLRPDPTAHIVSEASAGHPPGEAPAEAAAASGRGSGGSGGSSGGGGGDESRSVESFGSDKAIIWKTHKWEVKYETRR